MKYVGRVLKNNNKSVTTVATNRIKKQNTIHCGPIDNIFVNCYWCLKGSLYTVLEKEEDEESQFGG